jgi:hypothetical protein
MKSYVLCCKKESSNFLPVALTLIMLLCLLGSIVPAYGKPMPPLGSRGGGILCTDHFTSRPQRAAKAAAMQKKQAAAPLAPLEDTFLLHSYPSSDQKLFIDFDGFDAGWAYLAPWSIDGDDTTFNEEERIVIQETWRAVSEDFLPFNIDVTTEDPGISPIVGQRAVVDGSHQ